MNAEGISLLREYLRHVNDDFVPNIEDGTRPSNLLRSYDESVPRIAHDDFTVSSDYLGAK